MPVYSAAHGAAVWKDPHAYDPCDPQYGAKADVVHLRDGTIASATGPAVLSSATARWTPDDVGKWVWVADAGAPNPNGQATPLWTTIARCHSGGRVTLALPAATAVRDATVYYGTDDQAALFRCSQACPPGGSVDLGGRTYMIDGTLSEAVPGQSWRLGTIISGAPGQSAVQILAPNVTHDRVHLVATNAAGPNWCAPGALCALTVDAEGFVSRDCHYTGGYLACVTINHARGNRTRLLGGSTTLASLVQDGAGITAAPGPAGNEDIVVDGVTHSGGSTNGIMIFDSLRSAVMNCSVWGAVVRLRSPSATAVEPVPAALPSGRSWAVASGGPGSRPEHRVLPAPPPTARTAQRACSASMARRSPSQPRAARTTRPALRNRALGLWRRLSLLQHQRPAICQP